MNLKQYMDFHHETKLTMARIQDDACLTNNLNDMKLSDFTYAYLT